MKMILWTSMLCIIGCGTTQPLKQDCASIDWYEIGRQDGITGKPISEMDNYQNQCLGDSFLKNHSLYLAGRNRGLIQYCQPSNGFVLGQSGITYHGVCLNDDKRTFVGEYHRGARLNQLMKSSDYLARRSEVLREQMRLQREDSKKKQEIFSELKEIELEKQDIQKQIAELRSKKTL